MVLSLHTLMLKGVLFMRQALLAIIISLSFISFFNVTFAQAQSINPVGKISMEKAKQIALEQVKGKIIAAKQEKDDGIVKYEIIIETKNGWYEVEIDQATGKVLEVEKEGSRGDDTGEPYDD